MSAGPLMACKTLAGSHQTNCKLENTGKQAHTQIYTHTAGEANEQIIKEQENKSDPQVF